MSVQSQTLILILLCSVVHAACSPSTILFCDDFETGEPQPQWAYLTGYSYSSEVQSEVVRSGNYAHKTTLIRTDLAGWSPERAELRYENANTGRLGDTRWYAFSVYIPSDYIADEPICREIIWQLLMHPYINEQQKSPQFDFQIQADNLQIENRHSVGGDPTNTIVEKIYESPMSNYRGKWTDWVIYAKWSAGNDGRLRIWRNGNVVVDRTGANAYAGTGTHYFENKFGIYKWSWNAAKYPDRPTVVDKRVIYHDNLKIGGPDATYEDMTGTSQPATCPNGKCDSGETCSTCPSDCKCTSGICCSGTCRQAACASDNECITVNQCSISKCSNPGTCSAACTSEPLSDCIDGDSCCPVGCAGQDSDCKGVCEGTLALFHFDNSFQDSSGYSNTLTCNYCPSSITGKFSGAYSFDNDYLTLSGGTKDSYGFSVSLWFRTTDSGTMFSFREDPASTDYFFISVLADGKVRFRFTTYIGEMGDMTSSNSYNDGQWHSAVAVWDNYRTGKLFIDGVLAAQDTDNNGNAQSIDLPHVIEVGRNAHTRDDYFIGDIDELALWDHALSGAAGINAGVVCSQDCTTFSELSAHVVLWRNSEITIEDLMHTIISWKSC